MASDNLNLLKYTSRDYNTIKEDLLSTINSVTSDWTSREDSDPGIMLLNLMSSLGDNLSFNMDMQANEMYLSTVTQRKNMKKLLQLVGYKMHWYRSAEVYVKISNNSNSDMILDLNLTSEHRNVSLVTKDGNLTYTILPDNNNLTSGVYVISPKHYREFKAVQGILTQINISTSSIINNKYYLPTTNIDESHIYIYEQDTGNYVQWQQVDNLTSQTTAGRFFEFDTDDYDKPFIKFTKFWKTLKSDTTNSFTLYYLYTEGVNGCVGNDAFGTIIETPELQSSTEEAQYTITNLTNQHGYLSNNNQPGYDKQSVEDARADVASYITTYDTLVTLKDFERFVTRHSGFSCALSVDCQKAKDLNLKVLESISTPTIDTIEDFVDDSFNVDIATDKQIQDIIIKGEKEQVKKRVKQYIGGFGYKEVSNTSSDYVPDTITYEYVDITSFSSELQDIYNKANQSYFYDVGGNYRQIVDEEGNITYVEKLPIYTLDLYTVYDNFNTDSAFMYGENNRYWTPSVEEGRPFRRYRISDQLIKGVSGVGGLEDELAKYRVLNVAVNFPECRVFDWRVRGTIYLNYQVSQTEADTIIDTVITNLQDTFTANKIGFGQKISYMDVVECIQNADNRIRYFDAGYGTQPLIDYADCFDVDNYFNAISIFRFNQHSVVPNDVIKDNLYNVNEKGKQLLIVDSSCIISDN